MKIDQNTELEEILFDSSRKTADFAVSMIGNNPEIFKIFLDFAMLDRNQFSMRAARVIYLSAHNHPELVRPFIKEIILNLPNFHNDGVKRCLTKILTERSIDQEEEILGLLVSTCFSWLSESAEKAALKVYAMEILYRISKRYPDIQAELIAAIEELMPRSAAAIRNRGEKILAKLYREVITAR